VTVAGCRTLIPRRSGGPRHAVPADSRGAASVPAHELEKDEDLEPSLIGLSSDGPKTWAAENRPERRRNPRRYSTHSSITCIRTLNVHSAVGNRRSARTAPQSVVGGWLPGSSDRTLARREHSAVPVRTWLVHRGDDLADGPGRTCRSPASPRERRVRRQLVRGQRARPLRAAPRRRPEPIAGLLHRGQRVSAGAQDRWIDSIPTSSSS
jgi:hypothetical protein